MSGVRAIVLCDDIRREITGKDILIGVYSGRVVITQIPFALNLAIWLEYEPEKIGKSTIHLRITYSNKAPGKLKIEMDVAELTSAGIPLTGLVVNGDVEGDLTIEFSTDELNWQLLKTVIFKKGEVSALPTLKTALKTTPPASST